MMTLQNALMAVSMMLTLSFRKCSAVALGIAAFAYAYARKQATSDRFSFGTGKVNALGGFTGAILLAVFALYMVIESVGRLFDQAKST